MACADPKSSASMLPAADKSKPLNCHSREPLGASNWPAWRGDHEARFASNRHRLARGRPTRTLLRCVDDEASKRLLRSSSNFPLGLVQVRILRTYREPNFSHDSSARTLSSQLGTALQVGSLHGTNKPRYPSTLWLEHVALGWVGASPESTAAGGETDPAILS